MSKAYMRYAIAFLSGRPDILQKLGFHSIDDLRLAKNFEKLPSVLGQPPFVGTMSAKTFSDAFSLKSAPKDTTLEVMQKQFEIELSFRQFKQKLKEKDVVFLKYYENVAPESNLEQSGEKESNEIPERPSIKEPVESTATPRGLRGWYKNAITFLFRSVHKRQVIVIALILISALIIFYSGTYKSWFKSPSIASTEHKKKQYEAVINLYTKLQNDSFMVKGLFKDSTYTKYCMPIENIYVCPGSDFYTFGTRPKSFSQLVDDFNNKRFPLSPDCGHVFVVGKEDISYDSMMVGDSMEYRVRGARAKISCRVNTSAPLYFDHNISLIQMMIHESKKIYLPISIRNELMFFDSLSYHDISLGLCSKDQDYFYLLQPRSYLWQNKKNRSIYKRTDAVTVALYKSKPLPLYLFNWKIARVKSVIDKWLHDNGVE